MYASYGEALASYRVRFTTSAPLLSDLFDDADDDETLIDAIEQEWAERHHMGPGKLPAGWRQDRRVYELHLPSEGWFVDIERAETIAAVSAALGSELAMLSVDSLTTSELRGPHREITTMISDWLWPQVLDDGSLPHGVLFGSKHDSTWKCWAIWLRAIDDGKRVVSEPTKADAGSEILDSDHNEPLKHVLEIFNLKCF